MRLLLLLITFAFTWPAFAQETSTPRVLIGLYDGRFDVTPRTSQMHRFLEMPANHLGFDIHYYDVNKPLPALGPDVRGIVLWFNRGTDVPNIDAYLTWLEDAVSQGKKLVVIESGGMGDNARLNAPIMARWNRILSHIGVQDGNGWHEVTYQARITRIDPKIAGFERQIGPMLPSFGDTHAIPGQAESHLQLTLRTAETDSTVDLITTNANGGLVGEGYAIFHVVEDNESRISQWFVNPFTFLSRALGVTSAPIPDVTTLDGRRIFYSHIDGDGWNNISEIPEYNKESLLSAEVIRREVLAPYSDFGFSVGLVTADVDMDCYGLKTSAQVARDIYALPNVEPTSHTHSHPLFWSYFTSYTPEKEKPLLGRYPPKPKEVTSAVESLKGYISDNDWSSVPDVPAAPKDDLFGQRVEATGHDHESEESVLNKYYNTPRSYACKPYNIDQEISGSLAIVKELAGGKDVKLIQWPGDTSPYEEALAKTREAGVYNINGGDSRFDNEYPSYSSVSPVGLRVGNERQIYSSNSNENTYTNLWTGRFFGFRFLQKTVENTETPIRVRPFNIYFHIYSGQKQASLNAVRENLDFARTQNVIPIATSDFAALANGFFTAQIIPLTANSWKITNRGQLQTMRFDDANGKSVDFAASSGILGQNYFQNSLYVSLNPAAENPVIALKNNNNNGKLPRETAPYLIESRWPIKGLQTNESLLTIQTQGYGPCFMSWKMPKSGNYLIKATEQGNSTLVFDKQVATTTEGTLDFTITGVAPQTPLNVTIHKVEK